MIPFIDLQAQYQAYKKDIDDRIQGVLNRNDYILGKDVHELEDRLSEYTNSYAISAASGTDSLLIPLIAKNLQPGDEIITTPFSFFATVEVIALLKLTPVFVDINPETCTIDVTKIEQAITSKTKGIISVSLYGQTSDLDPINAIAEKYNLFHMEDAAQSFGAVYKGRKSCGIAEIGSTSFFPAKSLGGYGDGGMMFFQNKDFADKCRIIMNHGQRARYEHQYIGVNGRLDTLQAAIILAKFDHYEEEIQKRQVVADTYNNAFKNTALQVIKHENFTDKHVWAQYTLKVPHREQFCHLLAEKGIPTAIHYPKPLHLQQSLAYLGYKEHDYPCAEKASQEVVSLPMHPFLTNEHLSLVIDSVHDVLAKLSS